MPDNSLQLANTMRMFHKSVPVNILIIVTDITFRQG